MTPLATGVGIVNVHQNFPAQEVGIVPGDIITIINGVQVESTSKMNEILGPLTPGTTINLTVFHEKVFNNLTIKLAQDPENSSRGIIGVNVVNITQPLNLYRNFGSTSLFIYFLLPTLAPSNVPFSDLMRVFYTSSIGDAFYPFANLLFWIWFIDINLAIFNALPIYPLDGGQAFKVFLQSVGKNRLNEKSIRRITNGVTIVLVLLVILMIAVPYLI